MERSALYRRALAPVMTYVGIVGILAALIAQYLHVETHLQFEFFWLGVAAIAVGGTLLLVRRQAIKQGEAFWSPPAWRIALAMQPGLSAGLVLGFCGKDNLYAVIIWSVCYALALHAAGFFTLRGIRWFAWLLLAGAVGNAIRLTGDSLPASILMGMQFGLTHLVCGIYLYFTERKNEA